MKDQLELKNHSMLRVIRRLADTQSASPEEIAALLACPEPEVEEALFGEADRVRRAGSGNTVYLRAIIEFSNYCRCACYYCGIRAQNRTVPRYRMTEDEIIKTALEAARAGYRTVILQSGEDPYYTKEMVGRIVRAIRAAADVTVTLSLGERPEEEYAYWKRCGASRYLIKHETADEALYNRYHPHSSFQKRLDCLRHLKALGYEAGSGFMVGLPGTSYLSLARDLLLLKELSVSMAGIGPYLSHPETPLRGEADGSPDVTLRCVAVARLLLPMAYLPSTTALNIKGGMKNALFCGANVIMQKATPGAYRDFYDIYPGRESPAVDLKLQFLQLKKQLISMGFAPQ